METGRLTLSFIAKEDMTSVYEVEAVYELPQKAYQHFMDYDDGVLYILDKGGALYGVVSIGDLERFYEGDRCELKINRKYTFLNAIDYNAAAAFFGRVNTLSEIPVITKDKRLLGVIRFDRGEALRRSQRKSLKAARKGEYAWRKKEIERFVAETKSNVFLYTYSTKEIMKQMRAEEKELLKKRQLNADASKWKGLSEEEWKVFWQSEYEDGLVDTMRTEMEQSSLVVTDGLASFSDAEGSCYCFRNGCRITPDQPIGADRRIIMFGPCIVSGAFCKDRQTIASYLQRHLNEDGYASWKVLNRGLFGPEYCYHQMFAEALSEDDIVIIWYVEEWLPEKTIKNLTFQGDMTDAFMKIPSLTDHLADSVWHCNHIVNQELAYKIYQDLCLSGVLNRERKPGGPARIQDYYIGWDIWDYFIDYFEQYGLHKGDESSKAGAIVMNCNPFTKGHRYLIEQALGMTDRLYVFVVEEDKSYFKFRDRLKMVEMGVSDLSNVRVVPSGKYILSKDTFAQYFEKEQVQVVENMDYDIYIFGEVVAAKLGIQYRFVGEEPFDKVTKEYNETMKRILPEFGVEVVEIPRTTFDKKQEQVISATLVRRALQEKDLNTIEQLCPESTVRYLKEKFLA